MTVHTLLPRGIHNNNPLNIRLNPDNRWKGRVPPKYNSDGVFEQLTMTAAISTPFASWCRCGHRRTRTTPRRTRGALPRRAASALTSR